VKGTLAGPPKISTFNKNGGSDNANHYYCKIAYFEYMMVAKRYGLKLSHARR